MHKGLVSTRTYTNPDDEHTIIARQSRDGFLTFSLRISHLIEQTLLRQLKQPNFRKSTIHVIDESEDPEKAELDLKNRSTNQIQNRVALAFSQKPANDSEVQSNNGIYICDKNDTLSGKFHEEGGIRIRRSSCHTSGDDESVIPSTVSTSVSSREMTSLTNITSIPISWIQRGLTEEEKERIERSIASVSHCPHERKRKYGQTPVFMSKISNICD